MIRTSYRLLGEISAGELSRLYFYPGWLQKIAAEQVQPENTRVPEQREKWDK